MQFLNSPSCPALRSHADKEECWWRWGGVKEHTSGKLLQESPKDHCPSWKVVQGRELPLKPLFIPNAYGHSLPHGKMLVCESACAGLYTPSWQLAKWEGKVLGPRANRSIRNLSKAHLPPFPVSVILDGKGSFPAMGSHRGFTVELSVYWGIVRPLHLRQSMNSLTLPGTGLKVQASNWC